MPGVIKVDSVWTTFVKTPHPSLKNNKKFTCNLWRTSGLMDSEFDSTSSGPGLSPGLGHCAVFLAKTLYSHSASLHPGVQMKSGELNAGGGPAMD